MPLYDFTTKAGASAPPLKVGIRNENNSVVDITGAKGVKFYLRSVTGGATIINGKAGSVTDSVNGFLQYSWTAGDTSGLDNTEVIAEFHVTLADDTQLKLPDEKYLRGYIGDALN